MRWILIRIMPYIQDHSLHVLTSSPARYHWITDVPFLKKNWTELLTCCSAASNPRLLMNGVGSIYLLWLNCNNANTCCRWPPIVFGTKLSPRSDWKPVPLATVCEFVSVLSLADSEFVCWSVDCGCWVWEVAGNLGSGISMSAGNKASKTRVSCAVPILIQFINLTMHPIHSGSVSKSPQFFILI